MVGPNLSPYDQETWEWEEIWGPTVPFKGPVISTSRFHHLPIVSPWDHVLSTHGFRNHFSKPQQATSGLPFPPVIYLIKHLLSAACVLVAVADTQPWLSKPHGKEVLWELCSREGACVLFCLAVGVEGAFEFSQ